MKKADRVFSLRTADWILIGGLLVVVLTAFLIVRLDADNGQWAEVTVDGRVVATLPLDTDTTLVIDGIGGKNAVVVAHGKVAVSMADCPDKVCVRHRAISRTGESILCLPHKVAVTIIGGEATVDAEV